MMGQMLTIGEAAKLMGLCENTLRDWDIEGKFQATRTAGNHRRYSLEQIREYLEQNEAKPNLPIWGRVGEWTLFKQQNTESFCEVQVQKWKSTGYLENAGETNLEKTALAILLENCKNYYCSSSFSDFSDWLFSTEQALWLTKEVWSRSRFRKMVSIQPLNGPCGLAYYTRQTMTTLVLDSDAVAAKTHKCQFYAFPKADFDNMKEAYAEALTTEFDYAIFNRLPKANHETILKASKQTDSLKNLYDYVIVPHDTVEALALEPSCKSIDLHGINAILEPESFLVQSAAGRYPGSNFEKPIFCPYMLFQEGPAIMPTYVRSILTRSGWLGESNV